MLAYGTEAQKEEWIPLLLEGKRGFAFGITEPDHGSDATHMKPMLYGTAMAGESMVQRLGTPGSIRRLTT